MELSIGNNFEFSDLFLLARNTFLNSKLPFTTINTSRKFASIRTSAIQAEMQFLQYLD